MDHAPLCVSLLPELFAGGLPQLFAVGCWHAMLCNDCRGPLPVVEPGA